MPEKSLKGRLLEAKAFASLQISEIKEGISSGKIKSSRNLEGRIQKYVLYKYLLDSTITDVTSLSELSSLSVAKSLKLDKDKAILKDNPSTCEGTTVAMNKKVLLLLAVQRELGIQFPVKKTVEIVTTADLAQAVWNELS